MCIVSFRLDLRLWIDDTNLLYTATDKTGLMTMARVMHSQKDLVIREHTEEKIILQYGVLTKKVKEKKNSYMYIESLPQSSYIYRYMKERKKERKDMNYMISAGCRLQKQTFNHKGLWKYQNTKNRRYCGYSKNVEKMEINHISRNLRSMNLRSLNIVNDP